MAGSGKVSHAEYEYGRRLRWIEGEELEKVLAAEATLEVFADGVSTDTMMGRLRDLREVRCDTNTEHADLMPHSRCGMVWQGPAKRATAKAAEAARGFDFGELYVAD